MTVSRRELNQKVYERLLGYFGHQRWWPAETRFEVIVGAILTQNTSWKNVNQAMAVLREKCLLDPESLGSLSQPQLASLIRSSGYYNQKARKLAAFCRHLHTVWQNDLTRFLAQETEHLREELLSIYGIGPETADSIVLYAAFKPSFVVDTYTYRIFSRHDWIQDPVAYDELREYFMSSLEPNVELFQEYHALLVRTGHLFCRRKPLCSSCPLNIWLQEEPHFSQ